MMPYVYPSVTEPLTGQQSILELFFVTAVMTFGFAVEFLSHPTRHFHKKVTHLK